MLTFELDSSKDGIEVYFDYDGGNELIRYLKSVKNDQDHFHLLVGNELDRELLDTRNSLIKHVKLTFMDSQKS